MDINTACGISQAQTSSQISMAVAKKVQDSQAAEGDAAVALIQSAASTGDGAAGIDGRIRQANAAAAQHAGPGVDVYA